MCAIAAPYFLMYVPLCCLPAAMLENLVSGFFLLLVLGVFGLYAWYRVNPKNPISRGLKGFWNTPAIKQFRLFIWKAFWICFLGYLGFGLISWYFTDSGWYPRERKVVVAFKADKWIDGEVQFCQSTDTRVPKLPTGEVIAIFCSSELHELHVLKVKFWASITADRNKNWKCERFHSSMTCRLQ